MSNLLNEYWNLAQALGWRRSLAHSAGQPEALLVELIEVCREGSIPMRGWPDNANPLWCREDIRKFDRWRETGARKNGVLIPKNIPAAWLVDQRLTDGGELLWCSGLRAWSGVEFSAFDLIRGWMAYLHRPAAAEASAPVLPPDDIREGGGAALPEQSEARAFKPASEPTIHNAIGTAYDNAASDGQKPPNVIEIIKPVQAILRSKGLEASGRRIQKLAGAKQYDPRRRKPGRTLASDIRGERQ